MAEKIMSIASLPNSKKEFDACRFRRNDEDPENDFDLYFLRFRDREKLEFEPHPECDGVKYMILLGHATDVHPELYDWEYFEAYLGDPLHYVKNSLLSGAEGIIVKRCEQGLALMSHIISYFPQSQSLRTIRDSLGL